MDSAHIEHLTAQVDLAGKRIVDIGAGTGDLAEALAERGADVTGVEIDHAKVALAQKLAHGVTMMQGRAQALPVIDGSMDIACFFFSFHHIAGEGQDMAMAEVRRALAPFGRLHVVEPAPHGTMTDVLTFLEDETEVRTASYKRFDGLTRRQGFTRIARIDYTLERHYSCYEAFADRVAPLGSERRERLASVGDAMQEAFNRFATRNRDGYRLTQPCTAWHFSLAG